MRAAVIGSRGLAVLGDLGAYFPPGITGITEILSFGDRGVGSSARQYAQSNNIKLTEILPEYGRYGPGAPLKCSLDLIENADFVLAFWDGESMATAYTIKICERLGIPTEVIQPVQLP
jgi:hypothetical protein